MEGKRKRTLPWFWSILFIILGGGSLWYYVSSVTTGAIDFAVAKTGTITHERKVAATFANQEFPITAPFSGKVTYMGENGHRFRLGEVVATLQQEGAAPGTKQEYALTQQIIAPKGGLFFRQSDGLESIMTSENLTSMDLDKLMAQPSNVKTEGGTVQAGEAVGIIVNNLLPTYAFIELPSIDGLTVGKSLRLTVDGETENAKILRKSDKPRGVVVQFPHYVDCSTAKRRQDVTWVYLPPTNGVLVPKSALWIQGEELGIFLLSEGVVNFKKVKVLDQDDTQVCIENPPSGIPVVPSGIPVVKNPRDGIEGVVAKVKNI